MATSRKSVLITGCSANGIGAGLAGVFQEKGYLVFATLRTPSKLPATLANAPNVTVLTLDVTSSESIAAAVESVRRQTGGTLDVLVNNSGGGFTTPALDVSIEKGKRLFDLNYWAPMAMVQSFAPLLIKAKGCILNNTSANALMPMPLLGVYGASKAAFALASETWRLELAPLGVRTITLITMGVKTASTPQDSDIPELPESSYYYHIRDFIYGMTLEKLQASGLTTRKYALQVIKEVERGTTGMVWVGKNSGVLEWVWWLSPRFMRDKMIESIVPLSGAMKEAGKSRKS